MLCVATQLTFHFLTDENACTFVNLLQQLTSATVGLYHPLFFLKSISSNTGMLANMVCPLYKISAAQWTTASGKVASNQHFTQGYFFVCACVCACACVALPPF